VLNVLASGSLVRDPQRRYSSAGKPYATGLARIPVEDGEPMLVSLIAFERDAAAALLALARGDALAVAGRAKLTSWQKDGEDHHGLNIVVDRVVTLYQIDKRRRLTRAEARPP